LIRDVVLRVAVVVDMNLVEHVIVEAVEVGATRGFFEGNVVGDDSDRVGPVWADESVDVSVVGARIPADERRFAVTRGIGSCPPGSSERDGKYEQYFFHMNLRGPCSAYLRSADRDGFMLGNDSV
jgi:hypothetical protein